jgi:hypothetical protein
MAVAKWKQKDPADIADYWYDWSIFLPEDAVVEDQTVTAPAGITILAASHTDKVVRIRVSGGTAGTDYPITCLVDATNGEKFEVTKTLKVRERTDVPA